MTSLETLNTLINQLLLENKTLKQKINTTTEQIQQLINSLDAPEGNHHEHL